MEKNEALKIIKKAKRKSALIKVISLIIFLSVLFFTQAFARFILCILAFLVSFILQSRVNSVTYLLYDFCNPKLYYIVAKGLQKEIPVPMQAVVSEFIGDYSSAIAISQSLSQNAKTSSAKLSYMTNIIRNAFLAGDYELCRKSLDEFTSLSEGKKINEYVLKRNAFYLAYMDGDFEKAKENLLSNEPPVKRQKNSYRCNVSFFKALCDYGVKNYESAKVEFQKVTENYPDMYLSVVSKKYLDSMENGEPVEISMPVSSDLPQSARVQKMSKKDIRKSVISIFVLFCIVIVYPVTYNFKAQADTPLSAIEKHLDVKIHSVEHTLDVDENHIACVYINHYGNPATALFETKNDKYICKLANDEYISGQKASRLQRMHADGRTSEIMYQFVHNEKEVPECFSVAPISYDGKTIYFCYQIKPKKYHIFSFYSVVLDES